MKALPHLPRASMGICVPPDDINPNYRLSLRSTSSTPISNMSIPRIDLSGSSYDVSYCSSTCPSCISSHTSSCQIGFEHGTKLRVQIHSQLEVYRGIFKRLSGLSWHKVIDFARTFQPTIQRLAPDIYKGIEGIAAGSGAALTDIVALNARSEIALGTLDDGCTSLAWTLNGSNGRRQILAQNWDWTESVGKNLAMASITQLGKPKIWMVIEVRITPCLSSRVLIWIVAYEARNRW